MIPVIRTFGLVALLAAGPAFAQLATDAAPLPDVEVTPSPGLGAPADPAGRLPEVEISPLPSVELASEAPASPDAVPAPVDHTGDVAALRARFEALKQRDASDRALRAPASEESLARLAAAEQALAAADASRRQYRWKAESLALLAGALTAQPPQAWPEALPAGVAPDIALAVVDAQTVLYRAPRTASGEVIRTVEKPTTMLRIADTGAFSLLWSPADGLAFALTKFRKIY